MTTTMPPHAPGWSRTIPASPSPEIVELLRELLQQQDRWVLRPQWAEYLRTGNPALLVDTDRLTRDQFVAIHAWLRQQRHALHRAMEGGTVAPEGWIEATPLYEHVRSRGNLAY